MGGHHVWLFVHFIHPSDRSELKMRPESKWIAANTFDSNNAIQNSSNYNMTVVASMCFENSILINLR